MAEAFSLDFFTSSKVKVKVAQSCPTLCNPMDHNSAWNSPGQNTGVVSLSLLQGIFPTQGSNPGLPHCRRTLYHMSHQGSPTAFWGTQIACDKVHRARNEGVLPTAKRASCLEVDLPAQSDIQMIADSAHILTTTVS